MALACHSNLTTGLLRRPWSCRPRPFALPSSCPVPFPSPPALYAEPSSCPFSEPFPSALVILGICLEGIGLGKRLCGCIHGSNWSFDVTCPLNFTPRPSSIYIPVQGFKKDDLSTSVSFQSVRVMLRGREKPAVRRLGASGSTVFIFSLQGLEGGH